jgi:sugar phosphate isomerase/epimerase
VTCGAAACQRARRERTHAAWRAENPDYDVDRRWREAIDAAKAEPAATLVTETQGPGAGVPWGLVQDEMRVEARVILAGVVRVIGRWAQIEMQSQRAGFANEFVRHSGRTTQTQMEPVR